jgi:hypothetical protein
MRRKTVGFDAAKISVEEREQIATATAEALSRFGGPASPDGDDTPAGRLLVRAAKARDLPDDELQRLADDLELYAAGVRAGLASGRALVEMQQQQQGTLGGLGNILGNSICRAFIAGAYEDCLENNPSGNIIGLASCTARYVASQRGCDLLFPA